MAKHTLAAITLVFLSTGMDWEDSEPHEVQVATLASGTFSAEILYVRPEALVMTTPSGTSERELIEDRGKIFVIKDEDIQSVKTAGSSHVAIGLLGGGCIGCFVGTNLGCSKEVKQEKNDWFGCNALGEQSENAGKYGALGGAGGALAGAILGGTLSTPDSLWVTPQNRNFNALSALARYPTVEPEFLKGVEE